MNVSQLTEEVRLLYIHSLYTLKCGFLQELSDISKCKNEIFQLIKRSLKQNSFSLQTFSPTNSVMLMLYLVIQIYNPAT